jgi:hypothetical protein
MLEGRSYGIRLLAPHLALVDQDELLSTSAKADKPLSNDRYD